MLLYSSGRAPLIVPPVAATRNAKLWPFASSSAWNRPIGSGAVFTANSDIQANGVTINKASFSTPVYQGDDPGDPLVTITPQASCAGGTPALDITQIRLAANLTGAAPAGCYRDGFLAVYIGSKARGFTRFTRTGLNTATAHYNRIHNESDDLVTGLGWKTTAGWSGGGCWIAGSNFLGGLIRKWEVDEVNAGTRTMFNHVLQCTIDKAQAKERIGTDQSTTWRWPATWSDGDGGSYQGSIPMGALLAIPPSFNIEAQSWNAMTKAFARTLQNYGCYTVGIGSGGFKLYMEPAAPSVSVSLDAIRQQLRYVTNNAANAVGGGGTYPANLWPIPDPAMP